MPSPWKMGVIPLIPKSTASQDPHLPSNFRPIALTSCVGKMFSYHVDEESVVAVYGGQ